MNASSPISLSNTTRWCSFELQVKPDECPTEFNNSFYCDESGLIRAGTNGCDWGTHDLPFLTEEDIARILQPTPTPGQMMPDLYEIEESGVVRAE